MELYNLAEDPGEANPLEREHEMYEKLFRALQRHIIESGSVPWRSVQQRLIDIH